MDNRTEQTYEDLLNFRSMIIFLSAGASYHFSVPLTSNLVEGKGFFDQDSKQVDVGVHLQFRDELPGKDPYNEQGYNSAFGAGAETWFFNTISLRMGYYFEKRPKYIPPEGRFPFNTEVNFVAGRILNEIRKDFTPRPPIGESNFLFSAGVNLQWVK